ncbi:MAG: hypothetical protein HY245_04715 [Rhizobiales bacterium]|nr:hypothetical protein [Hyphomicrobiales bacterium]MBI3672716.1 hypothetical protein [Hyphomicrobiales bacterium]
MIRYTFFIAIVVGSAATAIAAVGPGSRAVTTPSHNLTIIAKNQAFPILGPIVVEPCATEDCSDAQ